MLTKQAAATAFAEGFVKECVAQGLSREQAEVAWYKAAQYAPSGPTALSPYWGGSYSPHTPMDPWGAVRAVGGAFRGAGKVIMNPAQAAGYALGDAKGSFDDALREARQGRQYTGWGGWKTFADRFGHEWSGAEGPFVSRADKATHLAAPTQTDKDLFNAKRMAAGHIPIGSNKQAPNQVAQSGAQYKSWGWDPFARPHVIQGQTMHGRPNRQLYSGIAN